MKRIALSLAAFALFGAMGFAQDAAAAPTVTISDWGRQILAVGNYAGKDNGGNSGTWMNLGTSWDKVPRIVGLNIQAKNEFAGFSITPEADNGTFGLTDQNKAWVTPMPGLTFESGINLETDTWRGTGDFGSYDWVRFNGEHGDSITFFRVGEGGSESAVEYNKDGVGAWAMVQNVSNGMYPADGQIGSNAQVGAAYTIAGLGTVKAQYLGYSLSTGNYAYLGNTKVNGIQTATGITSGKPFATIQAAFNLSSIENLYEEVGVLLPTSATDAGYVAQVSDVVSYKMDQTTFHGLVIATDFNASNNTAYTDSGFGTELGAGVDYDVGDMVTVGGDVRYINQLAYYGGAKASVVTNAASSQTGFSVGVTKGFSHGLIGIGFEYATAMLGGGSPNTDDSAGHWTIPVKFEESF